MKVWSVSTVLTGGLMASVGIFGILSAVQADTWQGNKANVEWAFKLGAVSTALEKCPFEKGKRFAELEANAREISRSTDARSQDEGREFMLIMDGPDVSVLCGTALRFFGSEGRDLPGVLAKKAESNVP